VNPRAEAAARLGGRYDARVLEPAPPAVNEPPWFADDPVGRDDPPGDLPRVSPVGTGGLLWEDLLPDDPSLADWCADRWLAAHRRLAPAPERLAATRIALHRLAALVMSPARAHANGKIALRFTHGGFGTPFFAGDVQLRVVADRLVVQTGTEERAAQITTLSAMAAHVGPDLLPDAPTDSAPLEVDPRAAAFVGDWFGFAASVLEELRAGAGDTLEPSRVQLWPEHFDLSVELGAEASGRRAGYGASPGDERHAHPYLYVTPWAAVPDGPLWQSPAFRGAELGLPELLEAPDQRAAGVAFFRARLGELTTTGHLP
jgi:hypothetical protein